MDRFVVNIEKKPMYIPVLLHSLLSTVKKINILCTLEEVLDAMKDYIYKNTLYDLKDPCTIHCDEQLRKVFNSSEFTLFELKKILLKVILKENLNSIENYVEKDMSKRKCDDNNNENNKKLCIYTTDSQIIDCEKNEDSGTEFTEYEDLEEISSDSSDIDSFFEDEKILSIKKMYDIEYEIESDCSSQDNVTDTDSDIEDILQATFISKVSSLTDEEFWADQSSEDTNSQSDVELTESDKWTCSKCAASNKPHIRYCLKCWGSRKGWLSERAPRKKKSSKKSKNKMNFEAKEATTSGNDNFSSSQETCDLSNSSSAKLCILCNSKAADASVVHGKTGHQFSCYKCARRLLSLKKTCPICRRQIDRVIHNIVM